MEPQPILFLISIDDLGLGTCEGQTDTGRGREREVQALGIIVWGGRRMQALRGDRPSLQQKMNPWAARGRGRSMQGGEGRDAQRAKEPHQLGSEERQQLLLPLDVQQLAHGPKLGELLGHDWGSVVPVRCVLRVRRHWHLHVL